MAKITSEIAHLENENKENAEDIKSVIKNDEYMDTLKLRKKLIAKCGELSLVRLSHLEEVFRHYCTHIFKTGKHMTFERLEYEKVHMTMDRFFLFLKDFELTTAEIDGKRKEVVEKQIVITIFKKVSSNARELSFEEFIQCIEKLALVHWDEKLSFKEKKKEYYERMQKIKRQNERRRKKKMGEEVSESEAG